MAGDVELATQYLQRLADVSYDAGDYATCSDACMRLGHLLSLQVRHTVTFSAHVHKDTFPHTHALTACLPCRNDSLC